MSLIIFFKLLIYSMIFKRTSCKFSLDNVLKPEYICVIYALKVSERIMFMGKHVVKNYPSPRLMATIGATNQSVADAIGELVANSFDARVNQEKIDIIVDLRNDEIKVIDNGKGMTVDVLEKAVCIAEDMSKYIERGDGAKGHYGMGFKTSCSTLGHFYEIFTRSVSGNLEYHVEFNIDDYSSRPTNADAWDVEIEYANRFEASPLQNMKHGTAFVIKNLKDKTPMFGAIYDYLGEAFKGHLEAGDTISFIKSDGEIVKAIPKIYSFLDNTRIEINEKFLVTEEDGSKTSCEIKGWMALDRITHNNGCYGFNIYRNNQLLEKWNKDWFKAHLMTSRIIGEVNMDFLESTFYKQGTQQSIKWLMASAHMEEYLKGIVKASRDVSRKGNINKPTELKRIVKALNQDYDIDVDDNEFNNKFGHDFSSDVSNSGKSDGQSMNDKIKGYVKEKSLILDDFGEIKITYLETENTLQVPFDYIFDDEVYEDDYNAELQVIVIKNHPLWEKKIDPEIQKILITSDSIYRMLVEKLKFDTSDALKIRNEWINSRTSK